jgi:hypothetical protein
MGHERKPAKHDNDDPLCVTSGSHADVWLFGEARDEYLELQKRNDQTSIREAASLKKYFERFAEHGPRGLSEQMFKPQDRRKTGVGNEVLIHEFKAYQFRIYGVVCTYKGKRCFLGTACDASKKKDKANPQKLNKAAEIWARIEK